MNKMAMLAILVVVATGNGRAADRLQKQQRTLQDKSLRESSSMQLDSNLVATVQAKRDRGARNFKLVQRLESRLIDAVERVATKGVQQSLADLRDSGSRVLDEGVIVVVECAQTADLKDVAALIAAKKGTVIRTGESHVKAAVPVTALEDIASNIPGVSFVRTPIQKRLKNTVITEGRAAMLAGPWHTAGFTGQGVKIAVIDAGFAGLATRKAQDEIPASAVEIDFTGTGIESGTEDHGNACAEIIYDMAPGCQMYLIKTWDMSDDEAAKNYCKTNGVQIISNSGGYDAVNFHDGTAPSSFTPHPVAVANDANANGILWVNAAGNEQYQHALIAWRDANTNSYLDWASAASSYRPYNELYAGSGATVPVGTTITGYLTWNEWPVTAQDFDLLLRYWNGSTWTTVAQGAAYQTGTQPPREELSYPVTTAGTLVENYAFFVGKYSATRSPTFILRSYPYELYYFGYTNYSIPAPGSLCIPGDASSCFTVGAIIAADYASGPIEYYSSLGPNNGAYTGNPTVVKPDICGPARVSTATLGNTDFSGTSAATPHIAGLAALVKSAYPTYTNTQLRSYIESRGVDLGAGGKDNTYGSGPCVLPAPPAAPEKIIGLSGNLSFGSVVTGQTSAATLTITNSGNTALTVTSITYPTCFSGAWSGTVAAGKATNVTVTFAPAAVTNYSGTVTVNSDATSGTNTISASGAGTADGDGNGLPDWWEQQYFGGTGVNPSAICSNGINTVREAYIAGLDPKDKTSVLRASIPVNGKILGWNATSGRVYSVYWATNLVTGFQCLESNIPWTRGGFTNSTTVPCGYYKIGVRLE